MAEPRDLAERAERAPLPPWAGRERFGGYGVMGLPFASGHILGMRRFPASSVGPGYTSVWHRDPAGGWTFYSDVEPLQSCNRFFGSAVEAFHRTPIALEWTGPRSLRIDVATAGLVWESRFASTPATRLMNLMGSVLPEALWRSGVVLDAMGAVAGPLLRAGKLRLRGRVPNGQAFIASPRLIWAIPEATAVLAGEELGPVGPVPEQAALGDFMIPQRGLLAFGMAFFEPFDAARHLAVASRAGG